MDYHITVDHRSAPQIPALLKQKLKSPLANWSCINIDSLLPQGRKFSRWRLPFAEAGGGNGGALSPAAPPCAELLFPLFRHGLTFSTVTKKSELGWTCSTPGTGRGVGGCLQFYKLWQYLVLSKPLFKWQRVGYGGVFYNLCFTDDC